MSVDDSMDADEQYMVYKENGILATCTLNGLRCGDDNNCRYCLTPIAMALRDLSEKMGVSR